MTPQARPLASAGTLLGMGLGGFVDGIVFHQLLQLHAMLTARVPKTTVANVEINMFWDGLFFLGTWTATAAGVALLFRAAERPMVPWSRRLFAGALLFGWGVFNLVEGTIDHHLLGIHHVVESAGLSIWDWAFLASGVVGIGGGWWLMHGAEEGGTVPAAARRSGPHAELARR